MEGLTPEQIKLLTSPRRNSAKRGYAIVRREGQLEKVSLDEVEIASFQGNAGTLRRSKKGRTYRLANGRRYFPGIWKDEVVAYLSK
jgi:hypothetical protein